MNKVYHVPAGLDGYHKQVILENLKCEYVLVNASAINNEKDINNLSEFKDKCSALNIKVLCDSGGFQLATGTRTNIDPRDIINIQNKVSNIGFILDKPPMKKQANGVGATSLINDNSEKFFSECIEATKENILAVKDMDKNFDYYFINQGASFEQLKRWFDELNDLDKFDGISTKAVDKEQLILGLMFVQEFTPYVNHHILGIGSIIGSVIINYFYSKSRTMNRVTFDSTSALMNSSGKRLVVPFKDKTISLSKYENIEGEIFGIKFETLKTNPYRFFELNVRNLNEQHSLINILASNAEELKETFNQNKYNTWFEIIDFFYAHGMEKTIIKYNKIFTTVIDNYTQPNLYNF